MSYEKVKKINYQHSYLHPSKETLRMERELIRLCADLTLVDFRKIRKGNYWHILDSIPDEEKKTKFTLSKVKAYLDKNQII